jgi:hypothetical protein
VKQRVFAALLTAAIACVAIGLYIGLYLTAHPGTAIASKDPSGGVQLYLATVPAAEASDPHPTWVSYYVVNSQHQDWQHKTTFDVPAHSVVHVTIFQYDGDSGLRNEFLGQASGTIGGTFTLNGKVQKVIDPDDASHIFAIPSLGVSVPLEGVPDNAKNPCGNAPCTGSDFEKITFSFRTGNKGVFRWQCFVPCAAGYIQGFGGPMQTVGYMDGFVKVV